jgi:uncharacterized protein (TIGR02679 family)
VTLPAALRDPGLSPLWQVAHARLSTGRQVGTLRIGPLDERQQAAVADLLGLDRLPGAECSVRLERLDAAVHDVAGVDTRTVVEQLVGRVGDHAAERAAGAAERTALWRWLAEHEIVRAQPALDEWVDGIRRAGTTSVPRTRALLESAVAVLARLPADGSPLPTFAEDVLDDPHALDDGTRLGGVVLRALSCLAGADPPVDAAARRALWEQSGVSCDQLSVTVLTAGLRPIGAGLLAQVCRLCAEHGHAAALTLAQLRCADLEVPSPTVVRVVENPSVLALALGRFGRRCPPVVCPSGWPNSAAILLLRQLARAGAELRYHGDLDGEGVRIAAYVMAKTGATPWRISTRDYRAAVRAEGPPVGRVSPAPWDPGLAPQMRAHGVAVVEEHVSEALLADMEAQRTHADGEDE